jgi:hypothetical protein
VPNVADLSAREYLSAACPCRQAQFAKFFGLEKTSVRKISLAVFLGLALAGSAAPQTVSKVKAEQVRKEIMAIEDDKLAGLLRGGSDPVDWIKKYDAEEIAQTNVDGSMPTKAQVEEGLRPGFFKMHTMKQDGHNFRVYDNGRVAVVTYHALGELERGGKVTPRESNFSDVWVKENGAWLRVLHDEREITKKSEAAPAK